MEEMNVPNPAKELRTVDLIISRSGMVRGARLALILPRVPEAKLEGFRRVTPRLTPSELRQAKRLRLDPARAYEVVRPDAPIRGLPVPPGQTWKIAIQYDTGPGSESGAASRFTILEKARGYGARWKH